MLTRTLIIAGAFIISTTIFSLILREGMADLNKQFMFKSFYNTRTPDVPIAAPQVVRLTDNQFVVVDRLGSTIAVYRLDGQGKLIRTSDNVVHFAELQPVERPTPRP